MTRTADIERLIRSGRRLKAKLIDARSLDSDIGFVRVAIVVPKWSFTAVRRNKLKRRLRELAREHLYPQPSSRDVVLRARREAYAATFDTLREDIRQVAGAIA